MKVKVNIINTWCIPVTVSFSKFDDDFNSFRKIACEGHTHARTDALTHARTQTPFL